jgi:transcriptional regulator with PAS, ATPase and Fis domain
MIKKVMKANSNFMKYFQKFDNLTGQGDQMKLVFRRIEEAAASDVTVLILGESGTGKELVAESIHKRSKRCDKPFIPVNTGAISRELVTSELFGHQRGAFTGATETKLGKFEQANKGTIFLDEISSMDETTQVSLLRVLETKKIQRIGGRKFVNTDVRVIAASNVDLYNSIKNAESTVREDLFHRLSVFTITLPPLRERVGDIEILAEELLKDACEEFDKDIHGFEQNAFHAMLDYSWPGNVREMKNVIQRAVLICRGKWITLNNLPQRVRTSKKNFENIIIPIGTSLQEAEKEIISKTLAMTKGNRKKAAEILGISRRALYNKMSKLQIV